MKINWILLGAYALGFILGYKVGFYVVATPAIKAEAYEAGKAEILAEWKACTAPSPDYIKHMKLSELRKPNVKEWRK